MSVIKYGNRRVFLTSTFSGNETIKTVNLTDSIFDYYDEEEKIYTYEDMYCAFANCKNLETVTNIRPYIYDMNSCFWGCVNLKSVDKLPPYAIRCSDVFNSCWEMTEVPDLPPYTEEAGGAFIATKITTAPIIPYSCYWLYRTFMWCDYLEGDVVIKCPDVYEAFECFEGTDKIKFVFVPFYSSNVYLYAWTVENPDEHLDVPTTIWTTVPHPYDDSVKFYDVNGNDLTSTFFPDSSRSITALTGSYIGYTIHDGDNYYEYNYVVDNDKGVSLNKYMHSNTYDVFKDCGYDEEGTKDNVWLIDLDYWDEPKRVCPDNYSYTKNLNDKQIVLTKYNGNGGYLITPNVEG